MRNKEEITMYCNNPECEKYLDEVTEKELDINNETKYYICRSCNTENVYFSEDIIKESIEDLIEIFDVRDEK